MRTAIGHRLIRTAGLAGRVALIAAAGGLLSAMLVTTSPGFGLDERALDPRFSPEAQAAIQRELGRGRSAAGLYFSFLKGMLHGDLGTSSALQQPISELIVSRAPVTAGLIGAGVAGGWSIAFAMAATSIMARRRSVSRAAETVSTIGQCVPAAVMALAVMKWGGPVRAIVALTLAGRLFEYIRNMLQAGCSGAHVTMARAMGIGPARVFFRHVLYPRIPEFVALAGVSFTMAFGACIPVEALCDLPGLGQLAWKAAIARDLPTLVALATLITIATQLCSAAADWAGGCRSREAI